MPDKFVGLMAKFPEKGKVKTRLAQSIGDDKALIVYQSLLDNVIEKCFSTNLPYKLGVFVHPPDKTAQFKEHSSQFDFYLPQSGETLGDRMLHAFTHLFMNHKSKKTILIGADIPDISSEIIEKAFRSLEEFDVVFGPAEDGGYYLIGLKTGAYKLFRDIHWGTDKVLQQSIRIAESEQLSYHLLPPLKDIDNEADLITFPDILKKII